MMPHLRQRMFIALAAIGGGIVWWTALPLLRAADGSSGISLFSSHIGFIGAVVMALLASIPAVIGGLLVSSAGHQLSGLFAVSAALMIVAIAGGPIDGWMLRSNLPGDYFYLGIETLVWFAGVSIMLQVITRLRNPMRSRVPRLAYDDHLDVQMHLRKPNSQAIGAGMTSVLVAGVISWLFMANSDPGQVTGSLLVAFTVGAMVGQMLFPQTNPIVILFSPAIVAIFAYSYVLVRFSTTDEVLAAWFGRMSDISAMQRIPGNALALPIYYASAGVAGTTLGIGIAHAIDAAKVKAVTE